MDVQQRMAGFCSIKLTKLRLHCSLHFFHQAINTNSVLCFICSVSVVVVLLLLQVYMLYAYSSWVRVFSACWSLESWFLSFQLRLCLFNWDSLTKEPTIQHKHLPETCWCLPQLCLCYMLMVSEEVLNCMATKTKTASEKVNILLTHFESVAGI